MLTLSRDLGRPRIEDCMTLPKLSQIQTLQDGPLDSGEDPEEGPEEGPRGGTQRRDSEGGGVLPLGGDCLQGLEDGSRARIELCACTDKGEENPGGRLPDHRADLNVRLA